MLSPFPPFYVLALELERAASRRDDAPARDDAPPPVTQKREAVASALARLIGLERAARHYAAIMGSRETGPADVLARAALDAALAGGDR